MADLYSNENFPLAIAQLLRQQGHNVLTSYEAGQANQGISDVDVLTFATQRKRSVITLNRDDFLELHRTGIHHAGIIICKEDRDYSGQAKAVHDFIAASSDLTNQLVRFRKLNRPKTAQQVFVPQVYRR